jgi:hypothetical protein
VVNQWVAAARVTADTVDHLADGLVTQVALAWQFAVTPLAPGVSKLGDVREGLHFDEQCSPREMTTFRRLTLTFKLANVRIY